MIQKAVFIGIIPLIIAVSMLSGCAHATFKQQKILSEPDTLTITVKQKLADIASHLVDTLYLIDSLIQTAHSFCAKADFPQAHSMLIEAICLIENENGLPEEEWNDSNNFFIQIAELYTSALPPKYIDSIPANITGMIFRFQLSMSIDTLSLSPEDSTILFKPECEDGLPYNLPIVRNKRVQNALFQIVTRRSRTMGKLLTRANYYLPFMQKLFAENEMPTDLTFLPILESGFNIKAYSYAHASGIWQFIPSTGRIYSLRKNFWIDERRDPIKSTLAAIEYLKKLYVDFDDWYLALAAYNCGEGNIVRAIKKAQTLDYWQLTLPKQTMDYVPQFIAYQIIGKNPQCFGFHAEQTDTFDFDTVHISDCLDLNKIAEGLNISYAELKKINPHIRQWCTPPYMEDVILYLPPGTADTFKEFFASLSDDYKVRWYRYRIKSGDNLLGISHRFKISVPAIRSINKLKGNFIIAGRYLYIPIPVSGTYPPTEASTKKKHKPYKKVVALRRKGIKPIKYRISPDETISEIAELFNVSIREICRWNNISNPRMIRSGTFLTLYAKQSGNTTK